MLIKKAIEEKTATLPNIHIPQSFMKMENLETLNKGLSSLGYEPRVIFCDLARQVFDEEKWKKDCINYTLIESLKNGAFMSTKYNPEMVYWRRKPHFVIFTNQNLDYKNLALIDGSCENSLIMVQIKKKFLWAKNQ